MKLRSKFERRLADQLEANNIPFEYEKDSYNYYLKVRAECHDCSSKEVYAEHWYTPDFFIYKDGRWIILEAKGKFDAKQRAKMISMKEMHPELDLRMVFMRDNKIHPKSKTRYSDWAKANNYDHCVEGKQVLPDEWIEEFKRNDDVDLRTVNQLDGTESDPSED